MLFLLGKIMLDSLAFQMWRQRAASARGAVLSCIHLARCGRWQLVVLGIARGALELFHEQLQLVRAELLAFYVMFGFEQLAQQLVGFVQLSGDIDEHLFEDRRIFRQAFRVDWHYDNYKRKCLIRQAQNALRANVYAASPCFL